MSATAQDIVLVGERLQFGEAVQACNSLGGELASILDLSENLVATELCQRVDHDEAEFTNNGCWIGLNNEAETPSGECGDTISLETWDSGEAINFTNFVLGQPDNLCRDQVGQHCVVILADPLASNLQQNGFDAGEWDDAFCSDLRPALCKVVQSANSELDSPSVAAYTLISLILGMVTLLSFRAVFSSPGRKAPAKAKESTAKSVTNYVGDPDLFPGRISL
mmetsp:Transcript_5957/g.6839  ORF Transcript_5957/g.6839 Transcript_5957/m.6839 type:complete len:222 (+) Transcript_5957:167-832(+)